MQTQRYGNRQNGMQASREEPDIDEIKAQFNDVFSLRKPKDAKAGLSSGAKSIGKGVLAGVVGLVAAPVMMAREEGVKGFAKGVGAGGICSLSILPSASVLLLTACFVNVAEISLWRTSYIILSEWSLLPTAPS